ncbi:MAG: NADH-quinone oxidoreductase subunit A [Bryobacteraceae bacterium]|jgi:NADH-quinone oxidoreductase subunit A
MPTSYSETYFPVLLQVLIAMAIAGGMLAASALLGRRVRSRAKDMPYECGVPPQGSPHERFSVKFYLVAMVFILFDIETVFLYPWAVVYRELRFFAFVEMFVFVVLILSGFYYIWRKGALSWSVEASSQPAKGGGRALPEAAIRRLE